MLIGFLGTLVGHLEIGLISVLNAVLTTGEILVNDVLSFL